jgi:hypothetical protein
MRSWLLISVITLGFAVGCSSTGKKTDVPAEAKAAASKTETALSATDKKADEKTAAAKIECSFKEDHRALEVRAKDKGCELAYTKGGQENVVASSSHGNGHCQNALNKIKERLTTAGFTCK